MERIRVGECAVLVNAFLGTTGLYAVAATRPLYEMVDLSRKPMYYQI